MRKKRTDRYWGRLTSWRNKLLDAKDTEGKKHNRLKIFIKYIIGEQAINFKFGCLFADFCCKNIEIALKLPKRNGLKQG